MMERSPIMCPTVLIMCPTVPIMCPTVLICRLAVQQLRC